MLAPTATVLPLLLSLHAAGPVLAAEKVGFSDQWNEHSRNLDWRPPIDHIYNPPAAGPDPKPWFVSRAASAGAADAVNLPNLAPPHARQPQRRYQPLGDGFVRLPVHRQTFNDTLHRRDGRLRRSSKPAYPNNGAIVGTEPNGNPSLPAVPLRQKRKRQVNTASTQPNAVAVPPDVPAPAVTPDPNRKPLRSSLDDLMGHAYMIPLDIGTPAQRVKVIVDTGSYELWVNPQCDRSADPALCRTYGHYNPQLSSTATENRTRPFSAVYGTGAAKGRYYVDSVGIGTPPVPHVQFAVASDTNNIFSGVLGLGYTYGFTTDYPTLLSTMWGLGVVGAPVFSIGFGGEGDGHSEIIFGGVNRKRFTGRLLPIDIWPPVDRQDPSWVQYSVNLTSIGISKPDGTSSGYTSPDFVMPAFIDTASTLSYLREDVVRVIGTQLNATVDAENNYWVDCRLRKQDGTVNFGFKRGNLKTLITVSYRNFIWETGGRCLMGIQPAEPGTAAYVLGDTFIRGAYLVFDQQSDVVWMADYYNCGDDIVRVGDRPHDTETVIGQC